ncbi:MAG: DAK2 domain-containing protein [Clostridiales bacterium]|nr:DAK2 domain-containing protein [Clostridiales bacterium]
MKTVDGQTLKRMLYGGRAKLAAHADEINALNVFPVPDGDTGTNMVRTLEMGWQAIAGSESDSACEIMSAFADGALYSARGNSGVILSQILRGIAKGLQGKESIAAEDLSVACSMGVEAGYASVVRPVEGTILTVFRMASEAATTESVDAWFTQHIEYASDALRHTPEQLPALKEANVVDSGGAGYLYLVQGMLEGLMGEEIAFADVDLQAPASENATVDFSAFTRDSELEFGYCTEFFLRLQSAKTNIEDFDDNALKDYLEGVGDSLVYVRMDDLVKVHVHTKTPGQVLNECQKYGEFLSMKIENMSLQHEETMESTQKPQLPKKHLATVAVAMSEGMKALFEESGADAVILGGAKDNPSTGAFLEAFRSLNAEYIVVLPNNSNIRLAAESAAQEYAKEEPNVKVCVLPTRSMQEGYAALFVSSDSEDTEWAIENMKSAAEGVDALSVTFSIRDACINGVDVKKGEYIGFVNKDLRVSDSDRIECLKRLLLSVKDVEDKEIVTVMYGVDVSEEEREAVAALVEEFCPDAEISEYDCGQELYYFLLGLE